MVRGSDQGIKASVGGHNESRECRVEDQVASGKEDFSRGRYDSMSRVMNRLVSWCE